MILSDIIALAIVYIYVVAIFIISEKVLKTRPEVSRKFLHIMVGNMIFVMPFFSSVSIMIFGITLPVTIALFFLTEYSPIKIHNSVTESGHALGLFFYALIWTILLFIFPQDKIWIVALAIVALVYGDGFASLIGSKFGKIKFHVYGGEKSLEGSITMFVVVAVVSVFVWMFYLSLGYVLPTFNFWYILAIAAVATICEAISYGGIDNITVPSVTALLYYLVSTMA